MRRLPLATPLSLGTPMVLRVLVLVVGTGTTFVLVVIPVWYAADSIREPAWLVALSAVAVVYAVLEVALALQSSEDVAVAGVIGGALAALVILGVVFALDPRDLRPNELRCFLTYFGCYGATFGMTLGGAYAFLVRRRLPLVAICSHESFDEMVAHACVWTVTVMVPGPVLAIPCWLASVSPHPIAVAIGWVVAALALVVGCVAESRMFARRVFLRRVRDGRAAPWRIVELRPIHRGLPHYLASSDADGRSAALVRPGAPDGSPYRDAAEETAVALVPRSFLPADASAVAAVVP